MQCPKCQFENRDNVKFCEECGAKFESECPSCNKKIPFGTKYCGECGHKLIEKKKVNKKTLSNVSERKNVTVLFSDMSGYTAITERLDPEEVKDLMSRIFGEIAQVITKYEGFIERFIGDAVMAIFGVPKVHEDDPIRAIKAAREIHELVEALSPKIEDKVGQKVTMHSGINTGLVVTGEVDVQRGTHGITGDPVNLASRLEGIASRGEILVGEQTFRQAEGYFTFKRLEPKKVKGKEAAINVYRVIAPSTHRTRFDVSAEHGLTPLVSRESELDLLLEGYYRSQKGRGQAFSIVSEAGIGKSRLLYEFRKAVAKENVTFLEGRCLSYSKNVAYQPIIDIMKSYFNIHDTESNLDIKDKVNKGLTTLEVDKSSTLPHIFELLSIQDSGLKQSQMTPEVRKGFIMEALKQIVLKSSEIRPLIIAFEDLHWLDESSEEVIRYLFESISGERVFLILTYRPEFVHAWSSRSYYNQVNLNKFSGSESMSMVTSLFNSKDIDANLEGFILHKTEGIPFFIEEFIKSLVSLNIIEKEGNKYYLAKEIQDVTIPSTIQDVIMARIDSLPESAKEVLQTGSVIEREFGYELIKRVMNIPEHELLLRITILKDSELLYERGIYPHSKYTFKHALTQEVAYGSLLKQTLREKHSCIARTIEDLYSDRLEEHYENLARHYERSKNAAKAVDYLILAGEKSNKHNAIQAASDFFQKALKLTVRKRIRLNPEIDVRLHRGLARASLGIGDIDKATEGYDKVIKISQKHGMLDLERKGLLGLTSMMYMLPSKVKAEQTLKKAISWAKDKGDKALESITLANMAHCKITQGEPQNARQIACDAVRMATATGMPMPIFAARLTRAFSERILGNPQKTIELTEGMFESLSKSYSLIPLMHVILVRGNALAESGRIDDSINILKNGMDIFKKFGTFFRLASFHNSLGYCYGEIHLPQQAKIHNLRSEELALQQMEKYPLGRHLYAELSAQASVNVMENLFDEGQIDAAWRRLLSFKEGARSSHYDLFRYRWETRMDYLAAQIVLFKNDLDKAKSIIQDGIEKARTLNIIKREGCFLRLLGELQLRQNEPENAIMNIEKAISILKEVGNPRHLWQAHASLASVYKKVGRFSEETENLGDAAKVIRKTANSLSDPQLKDGLLKAEPIRYIFSGSER